MRSCPPSVRVAVDELLKTGDVTACVDTLRNAYPNLNTLASALNQARVAIIQREVRNPEYAQALQSWEAELQDADETRKKEFQHFKDSPLADQVKMQRRAAKGSFMTCPADNTRLQQFPLMPSYFVNLKMSDEEMTKVCNGQRRRLERASEDVVRIESADALLAWCRRIISGAAAAERAGMDVESVGGKSHDDEEGEDIVANLAVAIALSTGRRMVELLVRGTFREHRSGNNMLLFSGAAKTGLQGVSATAQDIKWDPIPALAPASDIVSAVAHLRKLCPTVSADGATITDSRIGKRLNMAARRHVHASITFHHLRTLYTLLSFEAFKPHRYSLNRWASKVLLHTTMGTSLHYTKLQIYGLQRFSRSQMGMCADFLLPDE